MSEQDPVQAPKPPATSFHKRNLSALVAIVAVFVVAVIYILTGGEDAKIVRTEPRIPKRPELPPAALLEEPPVKPPPVIWEPPSRPRPPAASAPPPKPPQLAARAFESSITPAGARSRPREDSASRSLGHTREFLDTALQDLERQQARLQSFLSGPPVPRPTIEGAHDETVRFKGPSTQHRLDQGTLIEAQLLTAIDSHLPGQIVAQITHDVFDSTTLRTRLLPKGSRLLGSYDESLALGQNRLFVTWDRILFPDGSSLEMPSQPGVDPQGRSGLRDRVNHHVGRIFGQAALLSLIGAGFELAQPADGDLSRTRLAITGGSRELELAAAQLLRDRSSQQPTIKIRSGLRFHVLLNRDLEFKRPYSR